MSINKSNRGTKNTTDLETNAGNQSEIWLQKDRGNYKKYNILPEL